ncbi:DegT/DnrJ/EryC1/StrS family aminotransferase [Streptomyces lydicus]|uniref:DegT/DnrJ/EryC1/StrS family aminotransferase n=1 Tax=Streptomyces lydicus TaxID=47763 RepID=UPI00379190EB
MPRRAWLDTYGRWSPSSTATTGPPPLSPTPQSQGENRAPRHAHPQWWRTYADALADMDGVTLVDVHVDHAVPHLCQVRVAHRDRVFAQPRVNDIGVGVHYPPNHLQVAFAPWRRPLPATELAGKEILSLPFHPHLTTTDIDVVSALAQALKSATAGS